MQKKNKGILRKMLVVLLVVFVMIQFIRPAENRSTAVLATDITNIYPVPDSVLAVLKNSCYDCHSNNTRYPWYDRIQPAAWYVSSHVKEGKHDLNFSEFGSYPLKRQQKKFQQIAQVVKEDDMPLSSYTLIHQHAKLSDNDKTVLISWASRLKDSLAAVPK
jgi:hypothetical protein